MRGSVAVRLRPGPPGCAGESRAASILLGDVCLPRGSSRAVLARRAIPADETRREADGLGGDRVASARFDGLFEQVDIRAPRRQVRALEDREAVDPGLDVDGRGAGGHGRAELAPAPLAEELDAQRRPARQRGGQRTERDPDLSVGTLERAVRLAPNRPEYRYHLGLAYVKANDWARGRSSLEKALALAANFAGADDARRTLAGIR
jgi:tetratricopeptide (TPR) repeat protein